MLLQALARIAIASKRNVLRFQYDRRLNIQIVRKTFDVAQFHIDFRKQIDRRERVRLQMNRESHRNGFRVNHLFGRWLFGFLFFFFFFVYSFRDRFCVIIFPLTSQTYRVIDVVIDAVHTCLANAAHSDVDHDGSRLFHRTIVCNDRQNVILRLFVGQRNVVADDSLFVNREWLVIGRTGWKYFIFADVAE